MILRPLDDFASCEYVKFNYFDIGIQFNFNKHSYLTQQQAKSLQISEKFPP